MAKNGNPSTFEVFAAQPDYLFKPVGLMIWDIPEDAILHSCKIANEETVVASHGQLPAKVFARAQTYERLKEPVENGEEFFGEWMDAPSMNPSNRAEVILSSLTGTFERTRVAFWGIAQNGY